MKTFKSILTLIACFYIGFSSNILYKYYSQKSFSNYTRADIYRANPRTYQITSEGGYDSTFNSFNEMMLELENITVEANTIQQLASELDFYNEAGYLRASIYPTLDSNCNIIDPIGEVILNYSGPDYSNNATKDINVQLTTFYDKYDFNLKCGDDKVFTMYNIYGQD